MSRSGATRTGLESLLQGEITAIAPLDESGYVRGCRAGYLVIETTVTDPCVESSEPRVTLVRDLQSCQLLLCGRQRMPRIRITYSIDFHMAQRQIPCMTGGLYQR